MAARMLALIQHYIRWLHTGWPAGRVEKLPEVQPDGSTNVPGLYITGDLTGIPLLKFAADSGTRVIRTLLRDPAFLNRRGGNPDLPDVVIVGAGVSGMAAALEARKLGLSFRVLEASEPFSTIMNFPYGKPIYTYPTDMTPAGDLQLHAAVKESLVEELRRQTLAQGIEPTLARVQRVTRKGGMLDVVISEDKHLRSHRVVVAVGRSGNFRKLGVPGESLDKVYNRLHDPQDFCAQQALVVGGGDSALETAIALARCGAAVTLSYRDREFSRPKPENVDQLRALIRDPRAAMAGAPPHAGRTTPGTGDPAGARNRPGPIEVLMGSTVQEIREHQVLIRDADGQVLARDNDVVFSMIGREPPLDFLRRCGVRIRGDWRAGTWIGCLTFIVFCVFLYHWKSDAGIPINRMFKSHHWFPFNLGGTEDPASLLGTAQISMRSPSFYYSGVYCLCIIVFGIRRIRRRKTPYVTLQTLTLAAVQCGPLFVLPYVLLPWLGHNGVFDDGLGKSVADALFPVSPWDPQGREYWRSVGFILAWPLMFWNVFTDQPLWAWLILSGIQTVVLIPLLIRYWGKGAYCGWICSCGALAETMGDAHRHKMPHGPQWNRLNLLGQLFLLLAGLLLVLRAVSWSAPDGSALQRVSSALYAGGLHGKTPGGGALGFPLQFLNYVWFVDLLWAGILGVAFYFWFSGRVWCRFACPLAALMHIFARFSRFRILADKQKCISCNVCTTVCHQGIDVMNFANKGRPMEDPECVRCSACVQSCPTGVLEFGQIDRASQQVISRDRLVASLVRSREAQAPVTRGSPDPSAARQ